MCRTKVGLREVGIFFIGVGIWMGFYKVAVALGGGAVGYVVLGCLLLGADHFLRTTKK